jgi:amidase
VPGFDELPKHDALGLAELVRRKEVHPQELVEAAIERIERIDPSINAVTHLLFDSARRSAARPLPESPLAGVPYLIKDMVAHAGTPLTFGTALLRRINFSLPESHEVIKRTERAGLIVVGKTNACELGLLPTTEPLASGPTRNPWDPLRSPGGSSGGSAAAVAAGLVPVAHGNDGGGSIRIPASACGVFGLKPSRGRNPGAPVEMPGGITVEHCLSRTVRDSAALLDATRGPMPGDRWWAPPPERPYLEEVEADPGRLRIAFSTRDLVGDEAHADCVSAVHDAARLCEELGHVVEEARPQVDGERFYEAFLTLWSMLPSFFFKLVAQEARAQQRWVDLAASLLGERRILALAARLMMGDLRTPPFEPLTMELIALSERLTPADLWLALNTMQEAGCHMGRFLSTNDCYLTPVLGAPPVRTGTYSGRSRAMWLKEHVLTYAGYTPICNTSGLPAISVPLHWNEQGLPIGVQFIGRFGDEATLFRLAGQLERARPWGHRYPRL